MNFYARVTHSDAWKEFDRRCFYGLVTDWFALIALAILIVLVVGETQVAFV